MSQIHQPLRLVERTQVRPGGLSRWEKLSLAILLAGFKAVSVGTAERLHEVMRLFQPETVLKWHREVVKRNGLTRMSPNRVGMRPSQWKWKS